MNAQTILTIDDIFAQADIETEMVLPPSWTQGRTVYGGLSAALLLNAVTKQANANMSVRAMNIGFSAPTMPDMPFILETELLREGRTIAQWQARLVQNGNVCVQVHVVLGVALDSELNIAAHAIPEIPEIEKAMQFPSENAPGFIQHFQMAQSLGDLPLSGGDALELGGWMRFREPPKKITTEHLVALIDVWPPATMMRLKQMKAGSTVSWTLQFPQPMPQISSEAYLGYLASIEYSQSGYAITHAKIWDEHKQLLALSQQTVIVYG